MGELLSATGSTRTRSSAASSRSPTDLDAEFPAVAARRMGLSRVPLLCAREIPVPGALPRVIRVLMHCYPPDDVEPQHVYLGAARSSGWTSKARNRLPDDGAGVREQGPPHPGLPGRRRLRVRGRDRQARLQRVALPAAPRGRRGDRRRRSPGLNRYPDPTNAALRRRLADRHGVPANRIAIGNGSCDILLAAGDALLEPGAEVVYAWPSFSVYPHLAAASGARDRGPGRRRAPPRPRGDAARDHRRDPADDRLQPEQPDLDRAPARRDRRLRGRRPAPRLRDPRRGVHRVQPPPGPRRVDRAARPAPEPRPAAHVLEGLRPVRAAGRLRAVRLGGVPHRGRPGAPAVLLQRRRPGRRARGAQPPGRGRAPRRAQPRRADRARGRPARARHRAGRVAGQLRLVRPRRRARGGRDHAGPGAARRAGAGGALGRDGRCA